MPLLKTVEGWGFNICGIETVENNQVTKIFCETYQENPRKVNISFHFILLSILLFASY